MDLKILFLVYSAIFCGVYSQKKLKQVVILSRHNIRTPLSKNLAKYTPKSWPQWKEKSGYLTQKGALLEGFMGEFFSLWLKDQGLLPSGCPKKDDLYVYANVKQRTRASAQAFVDRAFPGCNVTVHHNDSDKMDPIFNPVIHNNTLEFKHKALEEMHDRLKSLSLNSSYEEISKILDYKKSESCLKDKKCDLNTDTNKIIDVEAEKKPNINGPLKIGNSAIDAFIMEYYEGFKNFAWGHLTGSKEWHNIMHLSQGYHNVIFNTSLIAKDIAKPLMKYMTDIFLNNNTIPKVMLLMGHDANMYTILDSMGFEPYTLENQYEITPVGGKIVFQKWNDAKNKKDYLKIEYVYQSSLQLRNGVVLSLENPPKLAIMRLSKCDIDVNGFCLWDDFIKLLENLRA